MLCTCFHAVSGLFCTCFHSVSGLFCRSWARRLKTRGTECRPIRTTTSVSTTLSDWLGGVTSLHTDLAARRPSFLLGHSLQEESLPTPPGNSPLQHFSVFSIAAKFGLYPQCRLSQVIGKLAHIPYAEALAEQLLRLEPAQRVSARVALRHKYFEDLPPAVYTLPDGQYQSILAPSMFFFFFFSRGNHQFFHTHTHSKFKCVCVCVCFAICTLPLLESRASRLCKLLA